jgi:hypothetical protein
MASETVKIQDGVLVAERNGPGKSNLEVSLSDVDSFSFERGGESEGQSDGTLTIFTKDGDRYPVRIADNEVGKLLKQLYAKDDKPAAKAATPKEDAK